MTSLTEENEQLRQLLFALQGEGRDQKGDQTVHHKLPAYVQNMDRLGDTELDLVSGQRVISTATTPSRNFFSTFLPQGRRALAKTPPLVTTSSPSQVALGRKDPPTNQTVKAKEGGPAKETKTLPSQTSTSEPVSSQQNNQSAHPRHKRLQEHEKERKELLSKPSTQGHQSPEKKAESGEGETPADASSETLDSASSQSRSSGGGAEGGGVSMEQPFIKLSQEEYGEHHSSIMHCRVDCSGRRVASLDVDGVVKVWSFNPIMQTKATIMSKSPLLSLEWATKPDRLVATNLITITFCHDLSADDRVLQPSLEEPGAA
ncbi:hypothetical protein LDENG_00239230 [Lucifuga dentata]|nr:hypothetical protein LDENG_00239230 [Lucifuga dentata]